MIKRRSDLGGVPLRACGAALVVEALEIIILLLVWVIEILRLRFSGRPVSMGFEGVLIFRLLRSISVVVVARAELVVALNGVGGALLPLLELTDGGLDRLLGLMQ